MNGSGDIARALFAAVVVDDHAVTERAERHGDGGADAARSAGHKRDPAAGDGGRTRRAVLENHDPSLSFQNQRAVLVGADHADDQRARRFGLVRDRDHELDLVVDEHRHEKIELLLEPQGAGAGQARADDAREVRRRQHAVRDALAELRLRRKRLVDVQGVVVAGHARERIDGIRGKAAPRRASHRQP